MCCVNTHVPDPADHTGLRPIDEPAGSPSGVPTPASAGSAPEAVAHPAVDLDADDEDAPRVFAAHRLPSLVATLAAMAAVWATWRVFVTTPTGQLLDDAARQRSATRGGTVHSAALTLLEIVSIPFLVLMIVATALLALVRRRPGLAVQAAALIAGANVTTQLLKHEFLQRPDLGVTLHLENALPSGHTTVAASVSAALVVVSYRRLRPVVALLGAAYTGATGVATIMADWHRPSDVVAAILVVVAWAGLVTACAPAPPVSDVRGPEGRTMAAALGGMAAFGGAVVLIAALYSLSRLEAGVTAADTTLLMTTLAGTSGVMVTSCVGFATILLLRRELEAGGPASG